LLVGRPGASVYRVARSVPRRSTRCRGGHAECSADDHSQDSDVSRVRRRSRAGSTGSPPTRHTASHGGAAARVYRWSPTSPSSTAGMPSPARSGRVDQTTPRWPGNSRPRSSGASELPADYRAVILLHDVEGLPNQEVGGILGLTVAAVKSRGPDSVCGRNSAPSFRRATERPNRRGRNLSVGRWRVGAGPEAGYVRV